jgi:topoisomerase-4 subunit A
MLKIFLRPKPRMKKTSFEFDFSSITIKGRASQGNILTKNPLKQIVKKEQGVSTLGARDIWFDESVKRLSADERGSYLGAFEGDDKILTIHKSGVYKLYGYELSTHFDEDMFFIMKYDPNTIVSVVYFDGNTSAFYVKRFTVEMSDKAVNFLNDHKESYLVEISLDWLPQMELSFQEKNGRKRPDEIINLAEFIGVKSFKAKGRKLSEHAIEEMKWIEPLPYEPPEEEEESNDFSEDTGDAGAEEPSIMSDTEDLDEEGMELTDDISDPETEGEEKGPENPDPSSKGSGQQIRLEFD